MVKSERQTTSEEAEQHNEATHKFRMEFEKTPYNNALMEEC